MLLLSPENSSLRFENVERPLFASTHTNLMVFLTITYAFLKRILIRL
jgi:hypothetical protein